ncbi:MAG: hypothetical protein BGP04_01700 [Rhizobiales bacterium 62-17]|nr:MAG: hypothetical protein BGP04_01700 [Rhizobiales bacterium 62-17]
MGQIEEGRLTDGKGTIVLVHGAWFGGWVWRDVARLLRAEGFDVTTPTMSGLGERRHQLTSEIDLSTHTDDIVNHIEMEDLRDVTLVGWSYGGMVANGVLTRVKDRIRTLVYFDAFDPKDGESLADLVNAQPVRDMALAGQPVPPPDLAQRWNVTDETLLALCADRVGPHPAKTMTEPVKGFRERPQGVNYAYVWCGANPASSFAKFYERASKDPQFAFVERLPHDHVVALTDPQVSADVIAKAARL